MAEITFFAPDTDPFVDSVLANRSEFEDQTGHTLRTRIIPSDPYFANDIRAELAAGSGADVFMSGPVLLWEHLPAGVVQPLDDFLPRAADYWDFADFLPSTLLANRWTGRFGDQLGSGPLLGIPVNCETYNLAYNRPVMDRLGLAVPSTWSEFFSVAMEVVQSGENIRGFAQRGLSAWHTIYTGFATQLWSYGASDFTADGLAAVDSAPALAASTDFVSALKASGPIDWTSQRWYELAQDFAAGQYALIVDSDHYSPMYESSRAPMARNVGYAMTPLGPIGRRTPNMWTWSLVMNARSPEKDAAWEFMQWASSTKFLSRAATDGNFNPTRTSVWDSEAFLHLTEGWGDYAAVSRRLIEEDASVLISPSINYRAVAEVWVDALRRAYLGESLEDALGSAAQVMTEMVDRTFEGL